jgi:hypothetical protein
MFHNFSFTFLNWNFSLILISLSFSATPINCLSFITPILCPLSLHPSPVSQSPQVTYISLNVSIICLSFSTSIICLSFFSPIVCLSIYATIVSLNLCSHHLSLSLCTKNPLMYIQYSFFIFTYHLTIRFRTLILSLFLSTHQLCFFLVAIPSLFSFSSPRSPSVFPHIHPLHTVYRCLCIILSIVLSHQSLQYVRLFLKNASCLSVCGPFLSSLLCTLQMSLFLKNPFNLSPQSFSLFFSANLFNLSP